MLQQIIHLIPAWAQNFAATCGGQGTFFGFPNWYEYLKNGPAAAGEKCGIDFTFPNDIPLVGLAVIEILLRIIAMVTIAFVIWGSIQYVVSQGEPDATARAKGTILNALIGMVVASLAIAIVKFFGNRLGG